MQEKVSIIVVRYKQKFSSLGSRFGITRPWQSLVMPNRDSRGYRQKFPSLGSRFGITRQSLVMPNRDPRDGNFCLYLTAMKDTYNLHYEEVRGNIWGPSHMHLTPAAMKDKQGLKRGSLENGNHTKMRLGQFLTHCKNILNFYGKRTQLFASLFKFTVIS